MTNYLIAPEDCQIVHKFRSAKSLRSVAEELNCDPSGLLRKVHRIASDHNLLLKVNGKWELTKKGHAVAKWVDESLLSQKQAISASDSMKIGTTTWFSEQLIVPSLTKLKEELPDTKDFHILTPGNPEQALLNYEVDFNITCYIPNDPLISYKKIRKEKWVVVVPKKWATKLKDAGPEQAIKFLSKQTFIRHPELNLHKVFPQVVNTIENFLVIDHMLGIRSALANGLGWSCIPELLTKSPQFKNSISIVNIPTEHDHEVCLSWLRSRHDIKPICQKLTKWLVEELNSEDA